ncbi:MAG: hypothetical protein KDB24_15670 [Microthrixaceae bacterium]|nr:hypothetical protein [Microthrixaceae bacterium]
MRGRLLALAGLIGAVLGSAGSQRNLPWLVAAAAVVLWGDNPNRPHPLGEWAAPLCVVSLVGVWASVPDTEPALAAGAVLAPLAVVMSVTKRPVGPGGTAALVVMVLGSVWVGSAGWGAALATACAIGMVVAAPAAVGFRRATLSPVGWSVVVAAHLLIAWPLTRMIMRRSVPVAVLMSAAGLAAAVLVALFVIRPSFQPPVSKQGALEDAG